MELLKDAIDTFTEGCELDAARLPEFFDALLSENDEELLAAVLTKWNRRGVSENELFGLASIMRDRCTRIEPTHEVFVDIVGTGGSRVKTFNVSTAAAFVVAGAGIAVAKHGNRAASSNTGSADVLSELGVQPSFDPERAAICLERLGICFMFAPNFHRLSPSLASARRAVGTPTVFNILGPLSNPAGAPHNLIGVWHSDLVGPVSRVLSRLGAGRSWVVNGSDGLDEITLNGDTAVAQIGDGIREFHVTPTDFGVVPAAIDDLRVDGPFESAKLVRGVLNGNGDPKATDLVLMSAAAAIHLASGENLVDARARAAESINCGAAAGKLRELSEMSTR